MASLWVRSVLLLVYLLLICLVSRLLEVLTWYQSGISLEEPINPLALSVKQLKLLLESRGMSYAGLVEKKELVDFLEAAGDVTYGEAVGTNNVPPKETRLPAPSSASSIQFSSGADFLEQVQDTRDGAWLVQVIPPHDGETLLDDYSWRSIVGHLSPFGIRTGIFSCRMDPRFCERRSWLQPLLLFAFPNNSQTKEQVVMTTTNSSPKPQAVLDWVHEQLSTHVKKIKSLTELETDWLSNLTNKTGISEVRVLLLSTLLHPPLFLAALSTRFAGRICFGMYSSKKEEEEILKKRLKMDRVPTYVVVTPESTVAYGLKKGEHSNFRSLNTYLKWIYPEMNDIFLLTLTTTNLLACLDAFRLPKRMWRHIARCLWTVIFYNFWLFATWLMILATSRFSVFKLLVQKLLFLVRVFSLTDFGTVVRADWLFVSLYPGLLVVSFVGYCIFIGWITRLTLISYLGENDNDIDTGSPWWEVFPMDSYIVNCLFRPIATLSRPLPPSELELEEGLDLLIERLAIPNLWLQPVIPTDYIKDLPVWKFRNGVVMVEGSSTSETDPDGPSSSEVETDTCSSGIVNQNGSLATGVCTVVGECPACQKLRTVVQKEEIRDGNFMGDTFRVSNISLTKSSLNCTVPDKNILNTMSVQSGHCSTAVDDGGVSHFPDVSLSASESSTKCKGNNVIDHSNSTCATVTLCESCQCDKLRRHKKRSLTYNQEPPDDCFPSGMLPSTECAVCLERYRRGATLCGLPCGHSYHQRCIILWLERDNHHCPICRWPAYRSKLKNHPHKE